ncbi:GNAT family N-acetyltransferase [Mumia sp. zg.B21]|uniref:GNAT family N-acetyltransferase n=1 Tax=Mumia sp. zg.B21 TaxID=2855447 RepID=UPI001C6E51EB|nr:GNAT family N-acetyltransferase [Mumia sp. zg.B21]MBW9209563.1 GNAT family N-acetyltransferase [Mumia sp. zg.B21]
MTTTVRLAAADDRTAVLDLLRAGLPDDAGDDTGGLEHLLWGALDDQRLAFLAERGGEVVGGAFGSVAERDGTVRAYVTVVVVGEGHRRSGVGRLLMTALEEAAAARGATGIQAGGSAPAYWWPGVDTADEGTTAFFAACGYEPPDGPPATNLDVDLATHVDLVRAATPASVPLRRLRLEEWPAFEAWMRETWGETWAAEAGAALLRQPVSCFVAVEDGAYLGFAAYDTNRAGWFGPMGSSPAARGRGIGSALLRACLSDYVDAGRTSCEIAWVGPVDFYARTVGAVPGRTFLALRKPLDAGSDASA